jgi:hypothetical protein
MRVSASIFLMALGANLTFAVHVQTNGFSVQTAGIILMIVGIGHPSSPWRCGARDRGRPPA